MPDTGYLVPVLLIVLSVLALAALVTLAVFVVALKGFHSIFDRPFPKPVYDRSPQEINQDLIYGRGQNWFYTNRLDFQNLFITSYDGLKLSAYYRPADKKDTRRLVILLHGWKDVPSVMAAFAQMYLAMGDCHILIPHLRAHGMSGGAYIGYGLADSEDLLMWTRYMESVIDMPLTVVYHGWSMGAATALIAAGSRQLPDSVAGVVADCPYASLDAQLRLIIRRRYRFAPTFLMRLISRNAKDRLGYGIEDVSPAVRASRISIPVLQIHGGLDTFVPPSASEEIYERIRSPKRLLVIEDAEHVMSYETAPSVYSSETERFLRVCGFFGD